MTKFLRRFRLFYLLHNLLIIIILPIIQTAVFCLGENYLIINHLGIFNTDKAKLLIVSFLAQNLKKFFTFRTFQA